jgi:hypothetical protein
MGISHYICVHFCQNLAIFLTFWNPALANACLDSLALWAMVLPIFPQSFTRFNVSMTKRQADFILEHKKSLCQFWSHPCLPLVQLPWTERTLGLFENLQTFSPSPFQHVPSCRYRSKAYPVAPLKSTRLSDLETPGFFDASILRGWLGAFHSAEHIKSECFRIWFSSFCSQPCPLATVCLLNVGRGSLNTPPLEDIIVTPMGHMSYRHAKGKNTFKICRDHR